jgi:hypothetical protein
MSSSHSSSESEDEEMDATYCDQSVIKVDINFNSPIKQQQAYIPNQDSISQISCFPQQVQD